MPIEKLYFVVWGILAVISILFSYVYKNAKVKKLVFPWLTIINMSILGYFFYQMAGPNGSSRFIVLIVVAIIAVFNIRNITFCEKCGRPISRNNLTPKGSPFCMKCSSIAESRDGNTRKHPPEEKSWIGGARIGSFNATYPFARLSASNEGLDLRISGTGIADSAYSFKKNEVKGVSLVFHFIPFFGRGLKIRHEKETYPDRIIFWNLQHRRVLDDLIAMGYRQDMKNTE